MIHRSPRGVGGFSILYYYAFFISIVNDSRIKNTCNLHAKVL